MNWIIITVTAIITALVSFGIHEIDVSMIRASYANQQNKEIMDCRKDKQITEKIANDTKNQLANLNSQLDRLREHPTCVPVTISATGNHGIPQSDQPSNTNSVSSNALYKLAAEGEKYRIQLKGCQDFIINTWKEKGAN